jgi:hypothetical protein
MLGNFTRKEKHSMTKRIRDCSFTVNPETAASVHDSGIVILHIGNGQLYASNGTGARIWRAVEEQLSLEAIADEISDAYQIARATAREHVLRFLAELERHTLIHREAES